MPVAKKTTLAESPPPVPRGEATRAKLIEAGHLLFLTNGFHGTSMRQIAEEAGIALGGIYNHFASKEDIFVAVLDAHHPYHVVLPALENTQGETIEDFMRDAAERIRVGMEGVEDQLLPLIFIEIVEFQGRHFSQLAEQILPRVLSFIQRLSERRGKLRDLPTPVIFRSFMGMMIGHLISQMILKNSATFQNMDDWFGGLVDIQLHGILDDSAPRRSIKRHTTKSRSAPEA